MESLEEKENYLNQFCSIRDEIKELLYEIEDRQEMNLRVLSVAFDKEYTTGSRNNDDSMQVKIMGQILEMQADALQRWFELLLLEKQIIISINEVSDGDLRVLLREHFILKKTWKDIAINKGYVKSAITAQKKKALEAFQMPDEPIYM